MMLIMLIIITIITKTVLKVVVTQNLKKNVIMKG